MAQNELYFEFLMCSKFYMNNYYKSTCMEAETQTLLWSLYYYLNLYDSGWHWLTRVIDIYFSGILLWVSLKDKFNITIYLVSTENLPCVFLKQNTREIYQNKHVFSVTLASPTVELEKSHIFHDSNENFDYIFPILWTIERSKQTNKQNTRKKEVNIEEK